MEENEMLEELSRKTEEYKNNEQEAETPVTGEQEAALIAEKEDQELKEQLDERLEDLPVENETNPNTLDIMHLKKRYGKREVVKDISFSVKGGEIVGLLGPNGAGKTTTFYMVVGFIQSNGGSIAVNGEDITGLPMYKRARMGVSYLPQEPSIFRKLSVEDNIRVIAEARRGIKKAQVGQLVDGLLESFGLTELRKQKGYTLSGGERRRTEIARCLATSPKFLLLDEPFAGIDPKAVYEIKHIVRRLASLGMGILITDHNVRDALSTVTCAHIVSEGTILVSGGKDDLLANPIARDIYFGEGFGE